MRQSWPTDPRTPHIKWKPDRHGNPRVYYWHPDLDAHPRLRETFGSEAFYAEYDRTETAVVNGTVQKQPRVAKWTPPDDRPAVEQKPGGPDSLNVLVSRYYQAPAFTHQLDEVTRRQRRRRLDRVLAREFPSRAWGKVKVGELPYAKLTQDFVIELQEDNGGKPTAGNALVKDFRVVFKWALKRKAAFPGLTVNPAVGVEPLEGTGSGGWRKWTVDDVHRMLEHYRGQRPAEWVTILLYSGARRGNASKLNDDMIFDGISSDGNPCRMMAFTVRKGLNKKLRKNKPPVVVSTPILPALAACLANMKRPEGEKHWLLGWRGRPYTCDDSLTHALTEAAKAIGIAKGSPHGLRKLGASLAAEGGASHADLMAIFGWETMSQPDLYIRDFQRQHNATRSMRLVELPPARSGRGLIPLRSHKRKIP